MSFLTDLIPTNLNEEKEKFFADNSYNPQFVYKNDIDQKKFNLYPKPQRKYLNLAKDILEKTFFGRNENDLFMLEGQMVSQSEVEKTIITFLNMHDLQNIYDIVWSSSYISRTSINSDTIKLKLPVNFRKEGLLGMLYHEIGTHALRRINYTKQPWFKKKKKYGFSEYLITEEGLATLHGLIPHTHKSAFISATRYFAVSLAQTSSFADTWKGLGKYVQDPERRWSIVYRQKRGMTDTSKPGGFTKDLVYFLGMVEMWHWLRNNNYDITNLYFGKLAKEDVSLALKLNPNFSPKLPSFFTLSKLKYEREIEKIGVFNGFDKIKP